MCEDCAKGYPGRCALEHRSPWSSSAGPVGRLRRMRAEGDRRVVRPWPDRSVRPACARRPDAARSGSRSSTRAGRTAPARLTFAELDRGVSAAARGAARRRPGARRPGRPATAVPASISYCCYLGALRAGLVAVPVNPAYTAGRGRAHPRRLRRRAAPGRRAAPEPCCPARHPTAPTRALDRGGEELAVLLYTSGTSGLAKGAMLSSRALLANLGQLAAVDPPLLDRRRRAVRAAAAHPRLRAERRARHGPVDRRHAGAGRPLRRRRDAGHHGRRARHGAARRPRPVRGVAGPPATWRAASPSVRFAMSGSTTLARGVVDGFAAAGVVVHDGYGLTEAAPVVTVNALGPGRQAPARGSVGTAAARRRGRAARHRRRRGRRRRPRPDLRPRRQPVLRVLARRRATVRTRTAGSAPATSRSPTPPASCGWSGAAPSW